MLQEYAQVWGQKDNQKLKLQKSFLCVDMQKIGGTNIFGGFAKF